MCHYKSIVAYQLMLCVQSMVHVSSVCFVLLCVVVIWFDPSAAEKQDRCDWSTTHEQQSQQSTWMNDDQKQKQNMKNSTISPRLVKVQDPVVILTKIWQSGRDIANQFQLNLGGSCLLNFKFKLKYRLVVCIVIIIIIVLKIHKHTSTTQAKDVPYYSCSPSSGNDVRTQTQLLSVCTHSLFLCALEPVCAISLGACDLAMRLLGQK